MEVLSSRILLRPSDPDRSRRFYRDTLRLAIYREFGPADDPGLVFFGGQGFLEVSGRSTTAAGTVGLVEMWVADPDDLPLAVVQIPEDHPLRRDHRDRGNHADSAVRQTVGIPPPHGSTRPHWDEPWRSAREAHLINYRY